MLDSKSQRLKQLTDDLVEASKISSGNIVLNLEPLNLTELLNQAVGEFSDRLEEKKLQIIFDGSDVVGMIYADSRRMWRIIEIYSKYLQIRIGRNQSLSGDEG